MTQVTESALRELAESNDFQVVAVWNIFQFNLKMLGDKSRTLAYLPAVRAELIKRAIPFEEGKRINRQLLVTAKEGA